MADSRSNDFVSCLQELEKEIVGFLEPSNLDTLSTKACEVGIISSEVKRRFDFLDSNVPRPRKIRYLLILANERLKASPHSPRLLERWLEVLCSHGVPSAVLKKAGGMGTTDVWGSEGDKCSQNVTKFSEEHVAALVNLLASCSGKWRHICMSLNLPRNIEKNLEGRLHMYDDMLCLREVLHEWIVGHHKHAKAPTLDNLKKALESQLVGLGKTARQLDKDTLATHGICFTPTLPVFYLCRKQDASFYGIMSKKGQLDIVSQPLGTELAENKFTLLEVEAVSTFEEDAISCEWFLDNCPLEDDVHYLGSKRSILCITGSLATEGTYTCKVRSATLKSKQLNKLVVSNPAVVTVNLPPHYKQVLVDMYHAQSKVHRDAWPPVGSRAYINLALVKQRELDRGDAYSCYTIQGDVDDVVCKKKSIGYDEAFSKHRSGALLLIEGRPGSGKTTLVHKVSQDWAKGNILKGAKYVFLISLRVLSAKAIVKLDDIMKELFYKNDGETARSVLTKINSANGRNVCFILDGLDEYEEQNSVVFELIRKSYLPRSMVIVSSRPSATFAYRSEANVYIEVIGFLKSEIQEYIINYPFSSRGSSQSLLPYLDQHPNVLRMCYLPVHVAMVSFLHDKIKGDLPSTECKMYEHFTNLTLRRKDGFLPPNSDVILTRICDRAFQMTISHTQFFIDTKELPPSDTNADASLGLVTVDTTAGLYGYHHLYTFVHLTFQEYLAAYYIAKLGEQEQREVISKYGHMDHMRVVLRFYCGLVSFEGDDPKFAKILKLKRKDHLFQCQCAFESQQSVTCKSVVLYNRSSLEFKATHPADFTCLGYVISSSSSPLKSLKITDISTGDQTAKLHACADVLKQCGQLKVLDFRSNQIGSESAKILGAGLRQCRNLSELWLNHNKIGNSGAKILGACLVQCSNLSVLCLDHNKIGDEGAKGLGNGLRRCSKLSELWLTANKIGDEGAKALGDGLRWCNDFSVLHLNANCIGDVGANGLGDGLKWCSNLSELWLTANKIGDEGAKGLGDGLKQCNDLSILHLNANQIGDVGAKGLGDGLRDCSKLSQLELRNNNIGDEGAKGLGDGLRQCSNLSELHLDINKIGDEGAKGLVDGLMHCNNLSVLYLTDNKICARSAKTLGDGLKQFSNLDFRV